MKKTLWIICGFLLFVLGVTSIILSMVGMNYTFLRFLTTWPPLLVFLLDVIMVIGGLIIVYLHATDWKRATDRS